jgi:hypothetical protein
MCGSLHPALHVGRTRGPLSALRSNAHSPGALQRVPRLIAQILQHRSQGNFGGAFCVLAKNRGCRFLHPALRSHLPWWRGPKKGGLSLSRYWQEIPVDRAPRVAKSCSSGERAFTAVAAKLHFAFEVAGSRMNNTEILDRYTASYAAHNNSWRCTGSCDLISCIC